MSSSPLTAAAAILKPSRAKIIRATPPRAPPPLSILFVCSGAGARSGGAARRAWRCHAISRPDTQGYIVSLAEDRLPAIALQDENTNPGEIDDEEWIEEVQGSKCLWQMVKEVKAMLASMGDGEISISAYDTAWVALVKDLGGSGGPQFPTCIDWIVENQLHDGSWGDSQIFSAHDRLINTLACVIALRFWDRRPDICAQGLSFIRANMSRLAEEVEELMPIGFEVAFPSLLDLAKELELDIPYDDPALRDIYEKRELKLSRIPRDLMHKVPTTLLHSLEGMRGLDWEKLLKLKCKDGSFLFSPSSTAYALMQTGNKECLGYLQKIIQRFGGVPNVYPVDIFEHLWAVDRLERLGISRYFEGEIKKCLEYVHRYWTPDGMCWARNTKVNDLDDTSMGFRLLRLHGYDVSANVFKHFEKDGEFFCFPGQSNQAITGLYNLLRASQVLFHGEDILERAKKFSHQFLCKKKASNQLLDKWIITKDLPGEVEYALDFPWYASLPRIETRLYLKQYGGASDVWIGKTLYRMPYVNNDLYLEIAKIDFNQCQALHQIELLGLQKFYDEKNLALVGVRQRSLLETYFVAAACIFEPERATERLGWAHTAVLAEALSNYFRSRSCTGTRRRDFIEIFLSDQSKEHGISGHFRSSTMKIGQKLFALLEHLFDLLASNALPAYKGKLQLQHIRHHLRKAWEDWLLTWQTKEKGDNVNGSHHWNCLGREETALLLVRTIEICGGRSCAVETLEYAQLARLTSSIWQTLQSEMLISEDKTKKTGSTKDCNLDSEMQELAKLVLRNSGDLDSRTRQTFFTVAKSYYYKAHCSAAALDSHISKVLFELVA